jgi:hypothetical protein
LGALLDRALATENGAQTPPQVLVIGLGAPGAEAGDALPVGLEDGRVDAVHRSAAHQAEASPNFAHDPALR